MFTRKNLKSDLYTRGVKRVYSINENLAYILYIERVYKDKINLKGRLNCF